MALYIPLRNPEKITLSKFFKLFLSLLLSSNLLFCNDKANISTEDLLNLQPPSIVDVLPSGEIFLYEKTQISKDRKSYESSLFLKNLVSGGKEIKVFDKRASYSNVQLGHAGKHIFYTAEGAGALRGTQQIWKKTLPFGIRKQVNFGMN